MRARSERRLRRYVISRTNFLQNSFQHYRWRIFARMASKGRVLNVGQNWPYVWACETQMWKRAILQHCINSKRFALSNVTISSLRMLIVWLHFFFRPPWFMLRCFSYLFCDSTRSGSIWNIVEKLSLLLPAYTWEGGVISVRAIERNKYLH